MAGVESTEAQNFGGAIIQKQSLWKLLQFDNKSEPLPVKVKVKKAHEVGWESLFLEFKEQIRYVLANTHSHPNEFYARNYIESETAVRKLLRDVHEMFEKPDTGREEVASAEIPTGKSEDLPTTLSADDFLEMGNIVKRIIHIRKITNVDDLFFAMERVNRKSINQLTEFFRGTIDTAPKSKNGALGALEMINFLRYEGDTKIRLAETVMKTIEKSEESHDGLDWLARIYAQTGKIEKLEEMEKQGVINDGTSFLFLAEACVVSEDPHELFPCWDRLRNNQKVKIGRTEYLAMTKACKSLRFPNQEYRVLLNHVHTDMVDFTHQMAKDLIDCCQRNKD